MVTLQTVIRLIAMGTALVVFFSCVSPSTSADKPHHTPNGFRNIHTYEANSFWDFIKWRSKRADKEIPGPESYNFPLADNDPDRLKQNREHTTLTWIGHATLLLQLRGLNILTDPHFSKRASPVQWAGPVRAAPLGMTLDDLPPIDVVVISHNHYDALDTHSIRQLYRRPGGDNTRFYVPLGLKRWFVKQGIDRVIEMDWWDRQSDQSLEIIAVPTQHWSKRSLFSTNDSLWSGWVIASETYRFIFVGDTGYAPLFKEIGEKLGPFDLAAIPIGAYEPRWFMRKHHVNPEESVQIHMDIGSRKSVGIHWGTFILTDEPLDEPPKRLGAALKQNRISPEDFIVLQHGQTIPLE
jgi:L-ascorbate metabolism protein UlaG (beta-lactamase superfamily)